jgi:hypothetical protein
MFGITIIQEPKSGAWFIASSVWRVDRKFGKGRPIMCEVRSERWYNPPPGKGEW